MTLARTVAVVLPATVFPLAEEVSREDLKSGWSGLIFMGLFFLALIALGIWWLRRS